MPEQFTTNAAWFDRALKVIPGGVASPVRSFRSVGGTPYTVVEGHGAHVTDVEGRTYIDMVLGVEAAGHFHDSTPNLAMSWSDELTTAAGFEQFFKDIPEDAMGIMIHSKLGVPVEKIHDRMKQLWRQSE